MLNNVLIILIAAIGGHFYFDCKRQVKLRIEDEDERHLEVMKALKTAAEWKLKYLKEVDKNKNA